MSDDLKPAFSRQIPAGDTHTRNVCDHCGFVAYENPKMVVGSVVRHEGKILLCRRAIKPRHGYWTIPAGYLELNELPADGAKREALEEANAVLDLHALLAVYAIPRISQIQMIYRANLATPHFSAGEESLEVHLFDWDEIPYEGLAFPSVHWALSHERRVEAGEHPPFSNPAGETGDMGS